MGDFVGYFIKELSFHNNFMEFMQVILCSIQLSQCHLYSTEEMDHDAFIPAGAQWCPDAHDRLCSLPRATRYKPLLSILNPVVDISYPGLSRVFPRVAQEESGTQGLLCLSQKSP